jgi:hypothetical protein
LDGQACRAARSEAHNERKIPVVRSIGMGPSCDIFIRSYYKDFPWLVYCLRSIKRYCKGFRRVILVVPESSVERLGRFELPYDELHVCPTYRDDYLGQQVTKLTADLYTDADHICHVDSDCIFRCAVTPEDLLEGDRLRTFMISYDRLPRSVPWRQVTQAFLDRDVEFEFMQRQPQAFPRWVYPALRAHAEARHGSTIEEYVLSRPHRGFSEFNALGAFAYYEHRKRFAWVDLTNGSAAEPLCKAYWSWGGLGPPIVHDIHETIWGTEPPLATAGT